ncbi:MAG: branched-chain amino acid transport system II carrier protein [Chlamydiae bacterium]|nr:branched-chain amino acid transport system II carrier protein [Chlamydiota bacterium]
MKKLGVFSLGIAIFAMFFGAGNIVFPLTLGRDVGSGISYAVIGFILTAVLVPILGFVSTILSEGSYKKFFSTIGKWPGFIMIAFCMFIVGVLANSRCVVISHSAIIDYLPTSSIFIYSLFISCIIFLLTFKENQVVGILGKILGPIKITFLFAIIAGVIFTFKHIPPTEYSISKSVMAGLKQGYFTLDLIGALFFSHLIYAAMKNKYSHDVVESDQKLIKKGVKAGIVGGLLLGVVYCGFGFIAALHGPEEMGIAQDRLFSDLVGKIVGPTGGLLANLTVALATLTTAIALTTVFADYLCFEIFKDKLPYTYCLLITILINLGFINMQFSGIMKVIAPLAVLIYPSIIVLSIANICKKFWAFKYTKQVFFATLGITALFQYIL